MDMFEERIIELVGQNLSMLHQLVSLLEKRNKKQTYLLEEIKSEEVRQEFLTAIRKAGNPGLTEREMNRQSPFRRYPVEDRNIILNMLIDDENIKYCHIETKGRKRMAYTAVSFT